MTSATITFQIVVGKRPANVTYVMYSMKQGSTRHEHSTLHTSIQYVHNVALTRAHRHEHVDVALQLRAVSTLHTWHKVTHLPRISPPPRNMASSPSLLAWPDRGGRAACRGHGCDTLHTTPCTPCCPVAQPLRSPPPPPQPLTATPQPAPLSPCCRLTG